LTFDVAVAIALLCPQPYDTYRDNPPKQWKNLPRRNMVMLDLVKKSMLTGIGLALKTWDEVEDMAKELQKRGEMSESEGRHFLDELQKRYEETQEKLEKRVEKAVKDFLKKTNIVTSDELKELKKEIRELKSIINAMTEKSA
jgi:polyhydroxyalkanoate synthesis regulator phasin